MGRQSFKRKYLSVQNDFIIWFLTLQPCKYIVPENKKDELNFIIFFNLAKFHDPKI